MLEQTSTRPVPPCRFAAPVCKQTGTQLAALLSPVAGQNGRQDQVENIVREAKTQLGPVDVLSNPGRVSQVAQYLAFDEASFVSGQAFATDGGGAA